MAKIEELHARNNNLEGAMDNLIQENSKLKRSLKKMEVSKKSDICHAVKMSTKKAVQEFKNSKEFIDLLEEKGSECYFTGFKEALSMAKKVYPNLNFDSIGIGEDDFGPLAGGPRDGGDAPLEGDAVRQEGSIDLSLG